MNLFLKSWQSGRAFLAALAVVVLTLGLTASLRAQSLGWEGETGIFVTPLAYTAASETHKLEPVVAYHYFNAGSVIGDFHEVSITMGVLNRFEFGYTHDLHTAGSNAALSPLWNDGFNVFHGKALLIKEKKEWVPAVSVGFMARTQVRNVGDAPYANGNNNADFYAAASKTVTQTNPIPVVLSAGVRGTNAELWGMGGNAPDWQARAFGALAFVFKGPARSTIIVGSEVAQQPHHPYGFSNATDTAILNIPTTLTYCVRFVPTTKQKLNFDFGIAQIAGNVAPGIDLNARHQAGVQVSYGF